MPDMDGFSGHWLLNGLVNCSKHWYCSVECDMWPSCFTEMNCVWIGSDGDLYWWDYIKITCTLSSLKCRGRAQEPIAQKYHWNALEHHSCKHWAVVRDILLITQHLWGESWLNILGKVTCLYHWGSNLLLAKKLRLRWTTYLTSDFNSCNSRMLAGILALQKPMEIQCT